MRFTNLHFTYLIIGRKSTQHGKDLCICFVDYEKAFDRVDWRKMMWMLKDNAVNWRDRNLIAKLDLGQKSVVRIGGELWGCCITSDVRQTDRRQTKASLNASALWRHNKQTVREGGTMPPPRPASWQYIRIYSPGGTCSSMLATSDISNKLTFDLLTLKVVSESPVTWATSVPILFFLGLSVLELGPMCETDRPQTASSLNAPWAGA